MYWDKYSLANHISQPWKMIVSFRLSLNQPEMAWSQLITSSQTTTMLPPKILPCDKISDHDALCVIALMCKPSYEHCRKFVRYEINFDDVTFISNAEKLPWNLVYK